MWSEGLKLASVLSTKASVGKKWYWSHAVQFFSYLLVAARVLRSELYLLQYLEVLFASDRVAGTSLHPDLVLSSDTPDLALNTCSAGNLSLTLVLSLDTPIIVTQVTGIWSLWTYLLASSLKGYWGVGKFNYAVGLGPALYQDP